jgi:hypothetical protein
MIQDVKEVQSIKKDLRSKISWHCPLKKNTSTGPGSGDVFSNKADETLVVDDMSSDEDY